MPYGDLLETRGGPSQYPIAVSSLLPCLEEDDSIFSNRNSSRLLPSQSTGLPQEDKWRIHGLFLTPSECVTASGLTQWNDIYADQIDPESFTVTSSRPANYDNMFDAFYLSSPSGVTEISPDDAGMIWLDFSFDEATEICCIELVGDVPLAEEIDIQGAGEAQTVRPAYGDGIAELSAASIPLYRTSPTLNVVGSVGAVIGPIFSF